jgi:hypothetical protein
VKRKKGKNKIKTGAPRHEDRPQDSWARCDHDWKGRERKGSCELSTLSCHCLSLVWSCAYCASRRRGCPLRSAPSAVRGAFPLAPSRRKMPTSLPCLTLEGTLAGRDDLGCSCRTLMAPIRSQVQIPTTNHFASPPWQLLLVQRCLARPA